MAVGGPVALLGQTTQSSPDQIDCSSSLFAASQFCNPAGPQTPQTTTGMNGTGTGQTQGQNGDSTQRRDANGTQVYIDNAGNVQRRTGSQQSQDQRFPPDPLIDLQRLAQQATGTLLPVFGRDLFQQAPSTFAPTDQIPALPDYVIGPGDEILLRVFGHEQLNTQLTVDSSGSIYVPGAGPVRVAGFRLDQLREQIQSQLNHTFRNYDLSVSLGHLRSIQVYVVGEARRPGAYTVSSLSTVLNALFVSGGPNVHGSLRNIQIQRAGVDGAAAQTLHFDLYDLALRGDKSQDIRLQPNDVIFIPTVGPQVALAGSVRRPAIYELKSNNGELKDATTPLSRLLEIAGGFSPTAVPGQIELERITNGQRQALNVNSGSTDLATVLRDGDVLYVGHISAGYEKSVTIRGNLANPGRFAWHPGMKLSEIIPDSRSLLTNDYWRVRNQLGVPAPLFTPMNQPGRRMQPCPPRDSANQTNSSGNGSNNSNNNADALQASCDQYGYTYAGSDMGYDAAGNNGSGNGSYNNGGNGTDQSQGNGQNSSGNNSQDALLLGGASRYGNDPTRGNGDIPLPQGGSTLSRGSLAEQQQVAANQNVSLKPPPVTIKIPVPEIDWSYAVIERLNPTTLRNSLVPFNLGALVQGHDASQDLELEPGDVVTILSQEDVHVGQDEQTKYIRLEGEFKGSGTYSVGPNETLQELVRRAGGLTTKAYLFGGSFTREAARVLQQQRLDEYIQSLSIDMERSSAVRAASATSAIDPNALAEERSLIAQLRQVRATGRVVLEFRPGSTGVDSIPPIPLENGDVFRVPSNPLTVSVIGAVNGQNVFLYDARRRVRDYILLAGDPNRIADKKHAFIIRADGSIFSSERAKGVFTNNFDLAQVNPGDTVVIPEKLIKPSVLRQVIDYSQIFSSFALGAAAINVVR